MVEVGASRILVLDCQEGLIEIARTQSAAEVRRGVRTLVAVGGALGIPAIASTIPAAPGVVPPVIAELATALPPDKIRVRSGFGALGDEIIGAAAAPGPGGDLLLAGIVTEGAVFATAMAAIEKGWSVRLVLEACAGLSARTEAAAIRQVEAAGGSATSLVSWVAGLELDLATPQGGAAMAALRGLFA